MMRRHLIGMLCLLVAAGGAMAGCGGGTKTVTEVQTVTKTVTKASATSATQPDVVVPDVTGLTSAAASRGLRQAGFQVVTEIAPSSAVPAGIVADQNPRAGSRVAPGTTVVLVVVG